jgi:hypothetical protein
MATVGLQEELEALRSWTSSAADMSELLYRPLMPVEYLTPGGGKARSSSAAEPGGERAAPRPLNP